MWTLATDCNCIDSKPLVGILPEWIFDPYAAAYYYFEEPLGYDAQVTITFTVTDITGNKAQLQVYTPDKSTLLFDSGCVNGSQSGVITFGARWTSVYVIFINGCDETTTAASITWSFIPESRTHFDCG